MPSNLNRKKYKRQKENRPALSVRKQIRQGGFLTVNIAETLRELRIKELRVEAVPCEQLIVGSLLHDVTIPDNEDVVGVLDR